MGDVLEVIEILLLVGIVVLLPIVGLAVRRRWMARNGGAFECSARLDLPIVPDTDAPNLTPSPRWVLGVGRYSGESFEWFRFFSYAWSPRLSWERPEITVVHTREPDAVEAISLYATHRVVRFAVAEGLYDVAMDAGSVTGFLAWLEAAPPGASSPSPA